MIPLKSDPDIKIRITRNFKEINISLLKLRKLIQTICRRFEHKESAGSHAAVNKYLISIVIVDDSQFRKINYKFLKRRSLSDCLSFDLSESSEPGSLKNYELIINGQMALRQANLRDHSVQAELALYIAHGLLHNFGFDDLKSAMAKNMHEKEDEILQELGYGSVYHKKINSGKNMNSQNRKHNTSQTKFRS